MATLLVRDALVLATLDEERREIANGGLFARDGVVELVGPSAELPGDADIVLDLSDHVVLPGLVEAFGITTSAKSSNRRLAEQHAAARALEQIPND